MRLINCFLLIVCIISSCNKQPIKEVTTDSTKEIDTILVEKNNIKLNPTKGQWFYNNKPFNGYAVVYYENDSLAQKTGFYNGKREHQSYKYFNNGAVKSESFYVENKLHGVKINYFKNGDVASAFNYVYGKKNGVQKTWFKNGQLAKKKNLENGKEVGLQQAWLDNGKLYVNYEARNGRVFGMMRASSCYKLENEKVVKKK